MLPACVRVRSDGGVGEEGMEAVKFNGHDAGSLFKGSSVVQGTEGDLTTFTSTQAGTEQDDPDSATELTDVQRSKTVSAKWLVRGLARASLARSPYHSPYARFSARAASVSSISLGAGRSRTLAA